MNKEIYFCVDAWSFQYVTNYIHEQRGANWLNCFRGEWYEPTEYAIKHGYKIIVTGSLAHLSFDLINEGYDIHLCYKDKIVKIEPHMDLSGIGEPHKDLRFGHNIFKLFKAGVLNQLLGIEKGE